MNVTCPSCSTVFRVDPRKVPGAGIAARCSVCKSVFRVEAEEPRTAAPRQTPVSAASPPVRATEPAEVARPEVPSGAVPPNASAPPTSPPPASAPPETPQPSPAPRTANPFSTSDPHSKARRLARALVSDMVVYHPDRRDRSLQAGTLKQDFREEIKKSWEEYVAQVGSDFARQTPYFREALNEILARGQKLF